MSLSAPFFIETISIGFALAMDAFSVSLANGLNEPKMKRNKIMSIALVFGIFQGLMPLIGYLFISFARDKFEAFKVAIPYISLFILALLGAKMIYDGVKKQDEEVEHNLTIKLLLLQGLATSIDALAAGFSLEKNNLYLALLAVIIIGVITFGICVAGVLIGRKFGTKLSSIAQIIGGIILIAIGIKICITGVLGI